MEQIKKKLSAYGLPRIIITSFFLILLVTAYFQGMNMTSLLSDVIRRWSMLAILVLAMVPGVASGIGLNFGISLGISGGLLGSLIAVEMNFGANPAFADRQGLATFLSFATAIVLAIFFASILGILYGILLNRVKGSEMTVSTYVGFSIVAMMNMVWLILPFTNGEIIWPVGGEGIRNTVNLASSFGFILNDFLGFSIGGVYIPTGTVLFVLLTCFLVWVFLQSKTGTAMSAAGSNPDFARASGVNVNKMRILGTAISTVLAGVGIVVYAQTFGFLQLYNAPLMMGFTCVAAVLIGGASINRATITHVLLGTFLFQGILAVALPVVNNLLPESNLSEVIRIIISNGIILYALTKAGGGSNRD